jgi:hypothetical protein
MYDERFQRDGSPSVRIASLVNVLTPLLQYNMCELRFFPFGFENTFLIYGVVVNAIN